MKADAIRNGVRPRRGMWLVSHARRRAYGEIRFVRATTIAWWSDHYRVLVDTDHTTIHERGYDYTAEPPADYERGF